MQDKDFDILIDKYLNDQLTAAERNHVEQWLAHITDQHAAGLITELETINREKKVFAAISAQIKAGSPKKKQLPVLHLQPFIKVAASLLIGLMLLFAFRSPLKGLFNIEQIVAASNTSGHITKTMLSDGSIVWLKGKSKLVYPLKFKGNLRDVNLEGEALFEIAKDPSHPFVIHCEGLTTRVLGTSFNIRHASHKIEINVLTGRVFLSSPGSKAIILHPYQKAVYSLVKKTIVKEKDPVIEVSALIRGTEYNMLFKDAQVSDVLQRIENKFNVHIGIESRKLKANRITADFTDQSLANTVSMLSEAFNLNYTLDGDTITLTDKQNNQPQPNQSLTK